MRNLKSTVAFLVVAAMLFASFTTFAYSDVDANANYAAAVDTLSALEIIQGDDKGNFNPDKTLTRAEAAAVIVRALGLEDAASGAAGATQFTDVASEHWASGYINLAAQSGIILGYGDGKYGPEDLVTYEQFVKMLVCAMGYEPMALTKGTYPTGYLITAKEIKLTAGVAGAAGQEALRKVVAQLTFNALDIPMMQEDWDGEGYTIFNGKKDNAYKTLLTDKLEVYKVYGEVVQTALTATKVKSGDVVFAVDEGKNDLLIGEGIFDADDFSDAGVLEVTAHVNGTAANDMLSFTAYAFLSVCEEDDGTYDIKAIYPVSGKNDTLVLAADDIDSIDVTGTTVTINYTDADEKDQVLTATAPAFYLNGVTTAVSKAALAVDEGSYKFVLAADDDEVFTTVFVDSYITAVVKEYNAKYDRIILKDSITFPGSSTQISYISLDTEDKKYKDLTFTLVDVNGVAVDPADLEEWNVLTLKGNADGQRQPTLVLDMIVSTDAVEGKIVGSKTVDGEANYTIDGKAYLSDISVAVTEEGIFYLNSFGKIAAKDLSDNANANMAFIYRLKTNGNDGYDVRVLDKNGLKVYTLDPEKKVKVDGVSVYGDVAAAEIYDAVVGGEGDTFEINIRNGLSTAELEAGFATLKANSDGLITAIDFIDLEDASTTGKYLAGVKKLGGVWLTADTLVYVMPEDAESADELAIRGIDALENAVEYGFIVLDTDNKGKATAVAIYEGTTSLDEKTPIAIITGMGDVLDGEDTVVEYTYLSEGKEMTVLEKDATVATAEYAVGDILMIAVDTDGYIDTTKTAEMGAINLNAATNNAITAGADFTDANSKRIFAYGEITEIENGAAVMDIIATNTDDFAGTFALTEVTEAYEVDLSKSKNRIILGDALNLVETDTTEGTADGADEEGITKSYALIVLDDEENLVSIVIVTPREFID